MSTLKKAYYNSNSGKLTVNSAAANVDGTLTLNITSTAAGPVNPVSFFGSAQADTAPETAPLGLQFLLNDSIDPGTAAHDVGGTYESEVEELAEGKFLKTTVSLNGGLFGRSLPVFTIEVAAD